MTPCSPGRPLSPCRKDTCVKQRVGKRGGEVVALGDRQVRGYGARLGTSPGQ